MIELPDAPGLVAVDTETTGGTHPDPPDNARVAVVSIAWRSGDMIHGEAYPFAFGTHKGAQLSLELEPDPSLGVAEWLELLEWLSVHRLVFHGAKFDLGMLDVGTPEHAGRDLGSVLVWDTMLSSRELDTGMSAELQDIEARIDFLPAAERKAWRASKKLRGKVTSMLWSDARAYAATDARVTLAACERQLDRYECGEGSRAGLDLELASARTLTRLERRGIGYDSERSAEIAGEITKAESKIAAVLPFKATPNGAKTYFFSTLGLEPEERTDTGQPRLDEHAVAKLVASDVPHARDWAELSALKSARTKWYEAYAKATGWDGRLRTVYSQATVISGRLSSTRVNLQAIPRDYQISEVTAQWPSPRSLFVPRKGARLWELDLSQAELRVAAVEAGCEPMLELIRGGADIHGEVTTQLFGDHPDTDTWEENRQIGKRADFALIFGIGADTFQHDLAKMTGIWREMREIHSIVNRWRRLYPEYNRAIKRYMAQATHWRYIRLVNGRVRRFATWEEQHKAFNQYVQGSLAEFMKVWLIEVEERWPGRALLTIHDSLVVETTLRKEVAAIRALGARRFEGMFGVPMVVDLKEWKYAKAA